MWKTYSSDITISANNTIKYNYTDFETLKELRIKILDLSQQVGFWKGEHRQAKTKIERLEKTINTLKGEIKKLKKKLFGKKSEKGNKNQRKKKKTEEKGKRGQQKGSEGHGRTSEDNLSIVEDIIDVGEEERWCSRCGLLYDDMGVTEDSDVIEVEVKAYKRRIKRKKYKKSCKCPNIPLIITAQKPNDAVIPTGKYANSFWILALLNKFLWHIPTYRLILQLKCLGLKVSQGTITGGLKMLLPLFEPLYEAIKKENRLSHHWHADETRWLVFVVFPGKKNQKWWLWLYKTATTVVFLIRESRGAKVAEEHYGEDSFGVISADRYVVYKSMLKTGRFLIAFCWAHVRRDFLDEASANPGTSIEEWALKWVELIRRLYNLNDERLKFGTETVEFVESDKKLRSAVDGMKEEYENQLKNKSKEDESSALSENCIKILESLRKHWSGLILFVEYPWIPMDNNLAERTIRGPVIGRKGYFGSGSLWSAELTAINLTILSTLSLWGINQKIWLEDYFKECSVLGGKCPSDISKFLPWNMSDEQLEKYGANPNNRPYNKAQLTGKLSELEKGIKTEEPQDSFMQSKNGTVKTNTVAHHNNNNDDDIIKLPFPINTIPIKGAMAGMVSAAEHQFIHPP